MTTANLLIPVAALAVKLGKPLTEGTADYQRAEQSIWIVSTRARAVADKTVSDWPDYTSLSLPDVVRVHVLEAAYRVFKNPTRYLLNQALTFTGQIVDELDGDVFLRVEREDLQRLRDMTGAWTQPTVATGR